MYAKVRNFITHEFYCLELKLHVADVICHEKKQMCISHIKSDLKFSNSGMHYYVAELLRAELLRSRIALAFQDYDCAL